MKAIICIGIPASGKSSFARQTILEDEDTWIELNRDTVRFKLFTAGVEDWSQYKFTKEREAKVSDLLIDEMAKEASFNGHNIICSDTNLNTSHREALAERLQTLGYKIEYKIFHCTLEEAWKRDSFRKNGVGQQVIYDMYQKFLKFVYRKQYVPDEEKQDCIVVDIDGTIAQMNGRHPFEWHRVGEDLPRTEIIRLIDTYSMDMGCEVIFLSGRDSGCREQTEEWLNKNVWETDDWSSDLFMRAEGDSRKDTIVKEELFWEHVEPNYNVKMVFDDRPCMIRLWYELGIPNVISVANPWKEF